MPRKNLQKSLQDYLSKIRKPTPQIHLPHNSLSSSKNWILSGCKHPKTPSFAIDRSRKDDRNVKDADAATLEDVDRFLFENFKSLYLKDEEDEEISRRKEGKQNEGAYPFNDIVLFDSPRLIHPPLNLRGSSRFFIASGSSRSLMEEARSSLTTSEDVGSTSTTSTTNTLTTTTATITSGSAAQIDSSSENEAKKVKLPNDCIAIITKSRCPYQDFKCSMQEMVESRLRDHDKVDWEFMEELLFCYLNLNDKKSYKFILNAFVDVIITLRRNSSRVTSGSREVRTNRGRNRRREGLNKRSCNAALRSTT